KKRHDAKPVAGKKKAFLLAIPNSKRPLAIKVVDAFLPLLLIKAQKNLCVRLRLEPDPVFDQIILQFDVIENLSMEHDGKRLVFVVHRLIAICAVNNAETRRW